MGVLRKFLALSLHKVAKCKKKLKRYTFVGRLFSVQINLCVSWIAGPNFILMRCSNCEKKTCIEQRRRHEFFQGRALGCSRGGFPSHFSISRGSGAQLRFLVASMVKMNEIRGQGGPRNPCLCLPTPMACEQYYSIRR